MRGITLGLFLFTAVLFSTSLFAQTKVEISNVSGSTADVSTIVTAKVSLEQQVDKCTWITNNYNKCIQYCDANFSLAITDCEKTLNALKAAGVK